MVAFFAAVRPNFRKTFNKKALGAGPRALNWVQGLDLNQRPSGYAEPTAEWPSCKMASAEFVFAANDDLSETV